MRVGVELQECSKSSPKYGAHVDSQAGDGLFHTSLFRVLKPKIRKRGWHTLSFLLYILTHANTEINQVMKYIFPGQGGGEDPPAPPSARGVWWAIERPGR